MSTSIGARSKSQSACGCLEEKILVSQSQDPLCISSPAISPWAVVSGVIIRVTIVITHIKGLLTLLITTHEPPSKRALEGPDV